MLGGDKKRAVNLILGPREEEKQEGAEQSALSACMGEFIEAVHAKNVDAAISALKSCYAEMQSEDMTSEEG